MDPKLNKKLWKKWGKQIILFRSYNLVAIPKKKAYINPNQTATIKKAA